VLVLGWVVDFKSVVMMYAGGSLAVEDSDTSLFGTFSLMDLTERLASYLSSSRRIVQLSLFISVVGLEFMCFFAYWTTTLFL